MKDIILKYGCPDLIFAIDSSIDQPSGTYNWTKFIYLGDGLEFLFKSFPVLLSDIPKSVTFFKPQSLESYMKLSNYTNFDLKEGKPVSWRETVK